MNFIDPVKAKIEQNEARINDYMVEIVLTIFIIASYVLFIIFGRVDFLFFGQVDFLQLTYVYLALFCLVGFKKFPILSVMMLSSIIMIGALLAYIIFKDSNFIIAGLTLVLIIVTFWYAYNTDRQFKVTENDRKGKYIAEISRSIFSPMHKSLNEAKDRLESGRYIKKENPIQIYLAEPEPAFYLTQNVEIAPDKSSANSIKRVKRPATFLLKIKTDDEILRYSLGKIESLNHEYDRLLKNLQSIHLKIENQFSSVLPDFEKYISEVDPGNFEYLLDASRDGVNYGGNVSSKIFLCTLTRQRCMECLDPPYNGSLVCYERDSLLPKFGTERWYRFFLLEFIINNRENILEWVAGTALSYDVEQLTKVQQDLLSTIEQLLETIDSLLLNWKLNYYLVEDEMHGE